MLDEIINYVQSLQNQVEVIKTYPSTLFHLIRNIFTKIACSKLIIHLNCLCTLSQFYSIHGVLIKESI